MKCIDCGGECMLSCEPVEETFRGETIVIQGIEHWVCRLCGSETFEASAMDKLDEALFLEYRRRKGFLTPGEIKELRRNLGMTQSQFENLMGVSKPTCSRWENGAAVQSETSNKLMILFRESRANVETILAHNQKGESVVQGAFTAAREHKKGDYSWQTTM